MEIEDGQVVDLIGDKDNPVFHGYTCRKGRELPQHLQHPGRLLQPQRRTGPGRFEPISSDAVVEEVAAQLGSIVDRHGPGAVALYSGTYGLIPPATMLTEAFMTALGSPMSFGCGTIDQPGKFIADALHGGWRGGAQTFTEAETWLFVGTNPLVSKLGGLPTTNPDWHLHRALKRGIQIVVIDPRHSEIARKAHIHLQPRPGEDAAVLAGLIRVVLSEGLEDAEFLAANSQNLDVLRQHVDPFTPEEVARRADVPAELLVEAARVFASSRTGGANGGTGLNMSTRGSLHEYLLRCLVTLCGFWRREGDRVENPGVLVARGPFRAQPSAPRPGWGFPPNLRVRGLTNTACGLPTGALAEEMLLEGEGQVRALLCVGGNPMAAWPDQRKTHEALAGLDLLVVIDPKLTQTAQLAHYVVPPKLVPEIPAVTYDFEKLQGLAPGWGFPQPYAHYRAALIDPPEGSDLLEDWEFLYRLGREMGLSLTVYSGSTYGEGDPPPQPFPLDMANTPTTDALFDILTHGSRVPLDEVRRHEAGALFEDPDAVVLPREPACEARLELGNAVMMQELEEAARGGVEGDDAFAFRLVSRRNGNTMNSQGRDQAKLSNDRPHNPAFMNPDDMKARGIAPGSLVAITSRVATIHAVAAEDAGLRAGVVSMTHCYGLDPKDFGGDGAETPVGYGTAGHTGMLASAELDYAEAFSGMPRMSALPVDVAAASAPAVD
jgi:anaerobic selenocysteine-containing dehydrogenase